MILVVDDDELVVEVVRQALESRGHIVGAIDDGAPVLSIVELKRPELVILDCGLPELPGIEALRQIRLSDKCYETPVLMLTGRRGDTDESIARRAGANDYLRKPFDCDNLIMRAERLINMAAERKSGAPAPMPRNLPRTQTAWGVR